MNDATVALIVMSVAIFLIFLGFLIWGIKSGQFKGVEEAKYQIFKTESGKKPGESSKAEEEDKPC
jgi:cbb3-type cytochrome oxidase maturation protein